MAEATWILRRQDKKNRFHLSLRAVTPWEKISCHQVLFIAVVTSVEEDLQSTVTGRNQREKGWKCTSATRWIISPWLCVGVLTGSRSWNVSHPGQQLLRGTVQTECWMWLWCWQDYAGMWHADEFGWLGANLLIWANIVTFLVIPSPSLCLPSI